MKYIFQKQSTNETFKSYCKKDVKENLEKNLELKNFKNKEKKAIPFASSPFRKLRLQGGEEGKFEKGAGKFS
jgi:hypothetical protein